MKKKSLNNERFLPVQNVITSGKNRNNKANKQSDRKLGRLRLQEPHTGKISLVKKHNAMAFLSSNFSHRAQPLNREMIRVPLQTLLHISGTHSYIMPGSPGQFTLSAIKTNLPRDAQN